MVGEIPKSTVLSEPGPGSESLTELMSRDPEGWLAQDEERVLLAIRAQRENWNKLEASGATKRPKQSLASSTSLSIEDLGI